MATVNIPSLTSRDLSSARFFCECLARSSVAECDKWLVAVSFSDYEFDGLDHVVRRMCPAIDVVACAKEWVLVISARPDDALDPLVAGTLCAILRSLFPDISWDSSILRLGHLVVLVAMLNCVKLAGGMRPVLVQIAADEFGVPQHVGHCALDMALILAFDDRTPDFRHLASLLLKIHRPVHTSLNSHHLLTGSTADPNAA